MARFDEDVLMSDKQKFNQRKFEMLVFVFASYFVFLINQSLLWTKKFT